MNGCERRCLMSSFLLRQMNNWRVYPQNSPHWDINSLPLLFRNIPEYYCNTVEVHISDIPCRMVYKPNQARFFFLPLSVTHYRTFLWNHRYKLMEWINSYDGGSLALQVMSNMCAGSSYKSEFWMNASNWQRSLFHGLFSREAKKIHS